jgi:hypothetical protein
MSHTDLVISLIMSGSDFRSPCSELHIYRDRVRYNGHAALNERVNGEFAMKVLSLTGYFLLTRS